MNHHMTTERFRASEAPGNLVRRFREKKGDA